MIQARKWSPHRPDGTLKRCCRNCVHGGNLSISIFPCRSCFNELPVGSLPKFKPGLVR